MSRIVRALVYNWPLKLLAILLATLLYAGLVVSQSSFELPTAVAIRVVNQPTNAVLLDPNLPSVTRLRYVANGDVGAGPTPDSFRATVDLSDVNPAAGSTYVKVDVASVDPRFIVVGYEPQGINVQLDPFKTYQVPVTVDPGTPPAGFELSAPELSATTVSVSGPESVVKFVTAARADVVIDPSGVFVDRDVPLIAVDQLGKPLSQVRVDPVSVHVKIAVFSTSDTKSLPVNPVVTGTPPDGYEIDSITVSPVSVNVRGDPIVLSGLLKADTAPIPIGGATGGIDADVVLDMPANVQPSQKAVHVTIVLRPKAGTRLFTAGIVVTGEEPNRAYAVEQDTVQVNVGGPLADLNRLDASQFTVSVDVAGLGLGTHQVTPVANLQAGLRLLTVDPPTITITITAKSSAAPAAPSGG